MFSHVLFLVSFNGLPASLSMICFLSSCQCCGTLHTASAHYIITLACAGHHTWLLQGGGRGEEEEDDEEGGGGAGSCPFILLLLYPALLMTVDTTSHRVLLKAATPTSTMVHPSKKTLPSYMTSKTVVLATVMQDP